MEKIDLGIDMLKIKDVDRLYVEEIGQYLVDTDLKLELDKTIHNQDKKYQKIGLIAIGDREDVIDASRGIQGYDDAIIPFNLKSKSGLEYKIIDLDSSKTLGTILSYDKISNYIFRKFLIEVGSRENVSYETFVRDVKISPINLTITNEGFEDPFFGHMGFVTGAPSKNRFEKIKKELEEKLTRF